MIVDRANLEQAIQMTSELDTIWNALECCLNFHVLLDDEAWDEVRCMLHVACCMLHAAYCVPHTKC